MGIDGGFIPKRNDIIPKNAKAEETVRRRERDAANAESYWTICAISGLPLKSPILISITGLIFNKEDLLSAIVNNNIPHKLSYLKHMKFLKEPDLGGATSLITYVCPLSNRSPSPKSQDIFVMLWKCGHIFLKSSFDAICKDRICPLCGEKAEDTEMIELCAFHTHEFDKRKHQIKHHKPKQEKIEK